MKDIDFDELDRAVSSLMGTVPAKDSSKDDEDNAGATEEQKPVAQEDSGVSADSSDVDDNPQLQDDTPPESPVLLQPSRRAVTAPTTRRGRFMDVVRPSAQTSKSSPYSFGSLSRRGSTIQPMSSSGDELEVTPDEPAPVAEPWNGEGEKAEDKGETLTVSLLDDAKEKSMESSGDSSPLSSPFLPDAKVEKRPLGRPTDTTPMVDLASELNEDLPAEPFSGEGFPTDISEDRDAQLPEQPMPAEFNSELLSIETGGDSVAPEAPSTPPMHAASEPAPSMTAGRSAMPSIPQQYKVQPPKPETDLPAGALYDAQPLVHAADKKPGWLWIVAIIGIILLGIGFGVAFYYLGLN